MDVRLLALVELSRELVLAQQLGDAASGGDVARGERGKRSRVDVVHFTAGRDELTVLVDDEDDLGVRVPDQAVYDRLDLVELLLVHHHLRIDNRTLGARRVCDLVGPPIALDAGDSFGSIRL